MGQAGGYVVPGCLAPGGTIGRHVDRLIVHSGSGQVGNTGGEVGSPHPPTAPVVPFLKHILKRRVQHPEVSLPVADILPWDLYEALVQRQVVSDAILPSSLVLLVVGEPGRDVAVYPTQSLPPFAAVLNGHRDESHVGVGWLLRRTGPLLRSFGLLRVRADAQELHSLLGSGLLLRVHGSDAFNSRRVSVSVKCEAAW